MSKSYSTANDQRVVQEGSGTLISPGAAVAAPGSAAVTAQGFSKVDFSQTITGLAGDDVQAIMDDLLADRASERASVASMSESLAAGLSSQAAGLRDIVAATKTPEANTISQLLPIVALGLVLWAVFGR